MSATTMKAVRYDRYGGPEIMSLADLPLPEPGEGQVRLRNRAASLNPYDWHLYRADPALVRTFAGWRSPGEKVLGADVAGVVDAVGPGVTELSVGDAVYGEIGFGACAEYTLARPRNLALKPHTLSFTEAAAVPMGALTSLQGLEAAGVPQGGRVLVIGASGGVGHMGLQLARVLGASRVVAVCSGRNAGWVSELGADRVIDYTRESVEDCGEQFDVILDLVSTSTLRTLAPLLDPDGAYLPLGGLGGGRLLGPLGGMLRAQVTAPFVRRRLVRLTAKALGSDLARIAAWIDEGKVRPHLDSVFPLEAHRDALELLESTHAAGKVVIEIA
ncbi:NAD(P)-dependent alcohol dehydrogenase [Demequina zhanjiangensis]|uniref:NAD(P)-dependent alcohol dehydrogenase n=1 Tax=Demequina zhanjiangensis TaxID=3051659 RepID=A0ABT8G559_9MICO|nr:NAD(P)-dependent alcohol dehydrogenase [Demequina sp. SYSU T00b26]MDN4474157.1 NAD(P)-dependent alcohol dehydrogenase [Demequina sp. SYSU T00b26]